MHESQKISPRCLIHSEDKDDNTVSSNFRPLCVFSISCFAKGCYFPSLNWSREYRILKWTRTSLITLVATTLEHFFSWCAQRNAFRARIPTAPALHSPTQHGGPRRKGDLCSSFWYSFHLFSSNKLPRTFSFLSLGLQTTKVPRTTARDRIQKCVQILLTLHE